MKKTAALFLALVIIFALVGCDVSTRSYRRYPYSRSNTTIGDTYSGSYNGTYRTRTRARVPAVTDGTRNNRNDGLYNYGAGVTPRRSATTPGDTSPYDVYGNTVVPRGATAPRFGMSTPANPTDGTLMNRAGTDPAATDDNVKTPDTARSKNIAR